MLLVLRLDLQPGTPPPVPVVYNIGGDDAPRRRDKRWADERKEREGLREQLERLLRPTEAAPNVVRALPASISPNALSEAPVAVPYDEDEDIEMLMSMGAL